MAKLYSSHPSVCSFPKPFDNQFAIQPASNNVVDVNLITFTKGVHNVLVNCINNNDKSIIQSWMLKVTSTAKRADNHFSYSTWVGKSKGVKIPYKNKTNEYCVFEVVSSNPDIVRVIDTKFSLNGGEEKPQMMGLEIKAPKREAKFMVDLFITDIEGKVNDCYEITVNVESAY